MINNDTLNRNVRVSGSRDRLRDPLSVKLQTLIGSEKVGI